ncbi:MAG TPA: radical SAM protein [Candidatus Thermoplasmatota archaeon]|nr:radical SAM protein [Candidatus Thermoplasmatota archaeon]
MFGKKVFPYSTVVELTLKCNMRCMHCGSSAGEDRKNELTFKEWVNVFTDVAELGGKLITLMGGEPFLRKEWYEIAKKVKELGMNVIFMSNGYCIDDEIISKMRKIEPHTVAISLDGATAETHDLIRGVKGSFEQCQDVLKSLRDADFPTTVVTTVHKRNYKELPQMREFLVNKNIAWQIQIADPIGRFPKNLHLSLEEFYSVALFIASTRQQYSLKEMPITGAHCIGYNSQMLPNITLSPKWTGCQAGLTALGIQSDGGVKGCLSLPSSFVEDNVRERSLINIWNDPEFCLYTRQFKTEDLNGDCIDCKFGKRCKGGCNAVSTSITGKVHCDPFCLYLIERSN